MRRSPAFIGGGSLARQCSGPSKSRNRRPNGEVSLRPRSSAEFDHLQAGKVSSNEPVGGPQLNAAAGAAKAQRALASARPVASNNVAVAPASAPPAPEVTMSFRDGFHPREFQIARIAREIALCEMHQLWRELARPVTFFDLCSPSDFLDRENRRILLSFLRDR